MLTGGTVVRTGFVQSIRPREEIAAIRHQPETEFEHARGHRHHSTFTLIHWSFSDAPLERDRHWIRINSEGIDRLLELYRSHATIQKYSFVSSGGLCHV
jgi:hypothetical protein